MCEKKEENEKVDYLQKEAEPVQRTLSWLEGKHKTMTAQYPVFMGCALLFGIIYAICMYRNPNGITYPVMVASGAAGLVVMMNCLTVKMKRASWFLAAVALSLAVSTCLTADDQLILMNKIGIFLLTLIFMVHQFYDDRGWSIGKYLAAVATYFFNCIGTLFYPFCQGMYFFRKINFRKYKTAAGILTGLLCAVPILIAAIFLLGQADAVFGDLVIHFLENFLNIWNILIVLFMLAASSITMYCLVSGVCEGSIPVEEKDRRTHEPVVAITCMSAVAVLYLFFSGIQIMYLFMGKGSLPEEMSYSTYARQGFFQLLFVAFMNLVMVLLNLKFFRKHRLLNLVLTVICACTYVMIASAAYRMILYVGEYHLTYLRVLVLWFLMLLALLMAGVTALIYRNHFPLFGYCVVVVSVFYTGLSFAGPERIIADYNAKYAAEWTVGDIDYMVAALSADAVPKVMKAMKDSGISEKFDEEPGSYYGSFVTWDQFLEYYYGQAIGLDYEERQSGLRRYNFSVEKARRVFAEEGVTK